LAITDKPRRRAKLDTTTASDLSKQTKINHSFHAKPEPFILNKHHSPGLRSCIDIEDSNTNAKQIKRSANFSWPIHFNIQKL
jgi:hypothetical protein